MNDIELFDCFNIFIGKKNNHFLWRRIKRIEPLPTMSLKPARKKRIKILKRFYTRYKSLEISPFD